MEHAFVISVSNRHANILSIGTHLTAKISCKLLSKYRYTQFDAVANLCNLIVVNNEMNWLIMQNDRTCNFNKFFKQTCKIL